MRSVVFESVLMTSCNRLAVCCWLSIAALAPPLAADQASDSRAAGMLDAYIAAHAPTETSPESCSSPVMASGSMRRASGPQRRLSTCRIAVPLPPPDRRKAETVRALSHRSPGRCGIMAGAKPLAEKRSSGLSLRSDVIAKTSHRLGGSHRRSRTSERSRAEDFG
jgi:hypothetical protein